MADAPEQVGSAIAVEPCGRAGIAAAAPPPAAERRLAGTVWQRLRQDRLAMLGLAVIVAFGAVALFAPLLAPVDPTLSSLTDRRKPPGREFVLGADELGRDILSRLVYGSRIAWMVGALSVGLALVVGVLMGLVSGYYGRWLDQAVTGTMDILLAFPHLLLAIAIVGALGPSLQNAMLAIAIMSIPTYVRLVRGETLAVKQREYIIASRTTGASDGRILWKHVLPNVVSPVIVLSTLQLGRAILAEAGLSFLGLGAQPPTPSWGSMIASGRGFVQASPHLALAPGLAIMLVVLGFNLLGDGLRDALDPKLRGD